MKKLITYFTIFTLIILACSFGSFWFSKNKAEAIRNNFGNEVSEFKWQLILFQNASFSPCWVFRGEYADVITGATFDVYTSLAGKVLKAPKNSSKPQH